MKRSAPLLLSMALCLTSLPSAQAQGNPDLDPAGGGTVVTVEGRIVQITVNLDVIVPATPEGLDPLPQRWFDMIRRGFAAAASYWNQAFRGALAANCFAIELSLVVNFIDENDSAAGGGHDVFVHPWFSPTFESPQLPTETTNDDTAEVFTTNGTAYLPTWIFQPDARDLAHELGHMFGLGDEVTRDAAGNVVDYRGRDGTLMDGGDEIDQVLIDRIGDLARRSGASLPECWEGTTNSTVTTLYGGGPCGNPVQVQGTVQLVVAEDGSVAGTFDVTGCGVSQPHGEITGTATDEGFVFPQFVVYTNGSLIPKVSSTHAEATLTNMQGPAVTWVTTWDLTCVTCA